MVHLTDSNGYVQGTSDTSLTGNGASAGGEQFNLVNIPANCYIWNGATTQEDAKARPFEIGGKTYYCPGLPTKEHGQGPQLDGPTAIAMCDMMGDGCQGVRKLSTPQCTDVKITDTGSACFAPKQTIQPTTFTTYDCQSSSSPGKDPKKCNFGGPENSWFKQPPPSGTNYIQGGLQYQNPPVQSLGFGNDEQFNLVNIPANCYIWNGATTQEDAKARPFEIGDKTYYCPGLPTKEHGQGPQLDGPTAIAMCDMMAGGCQGVRKLSTPQCTDVKITDTGSACFAPKQTIQPTTFTTYDCQSSSSPGKDPKKCNFGGPENSWYKTGKSSNGALWCLASITKIPKVVNGSIEHVEIKDLKVGDIVQTTRGNMPISDIMKTNTRGYVHDNYVKVAKDALGENFPSEDLYVTHEHSFSLGYYKNSLLNRNIHDNDQDDMVYLHITADKLADKLPGVTRVSKEFDSAINLVFDEHTSINIYGLDVVTHHPKGNPYILPEEKYQDKSKFNSKVQKPLFASFDMLVNAKPEHMEMKDFLRGCITADLENKLNLENVNNISFTPQKTMLTEDLRQKLKV